MNKFIIISVHILLAILTAVLTFGTAVLVAYLFVKNESNDKLVAELPNILYGVLTGLMVSFIMLIIKHYSEEIKIREDIQLKTTELRKKVNYNEFSSTLYLSRSAVCDIEEFTEFVQSNIKKSFLKKAFERLEVELSNFVKELKKYDAKITTVNVKATFKNILEISDNLI